MKRTRLSYLILAAVVLIGTVSTAQATDITWTLNNVVFSDLGTASGTFSIDPTTGNLDGYDITTIQTTTGYTGYHYDSYDSLSYSTNVTADSISLIPTGPNAPAILDLMFQYSLSTAGLDPLLLTSFEQGHNCCGTFTRTVVSGEATSDNYATPEPETYTLMLTGLGMLGLLRCRKQISA